MNVNFCQLRKQLWIFCCCFRYKDRGRWSLSPQLIFEASACIFQQKESKKCKVLLNTQSITGVPTLLYYMCVEEERCDFILDIFFLQVGFGRVFLLLNIFEFFFCIYRSGWAVVRSILSAPVYVIYLPVSACCLMTSPVYIITRSGSCGVCLTGACCLLSEL